MTTEPASKVLCELIEEFAKWGFDADRALWATRFVRMFARERGIEIGEPDFWEQKILDWIND